MKKGMILLLSFFLICLVLIHIVYTCTNNTCNKKINALKEIAILEEKRKRIEKIVSYIQTVNPRVYNELAYTIANEIVKYPNWKLLLGIITVESHFNIFANSKYAIGIAQINYTFWKKNSNILDNITIYKLYSPEINIKISNSILDILKKECKTEQIDCMLTKYFGGTNKEYYKKVMQAIGMFELSNQNKEVF